MPITKQTIAIIGAGGKMGSAIAQHVAGGNYRLLLFDKNSGKLSSLEEQVKEQYPHADVKPMNCAHDCSWEADMIILAVPHDQEKEIADKVRDVATQKIVVSLANPVEEPRDKGAKEPISSAAEELQQWLPYSKVVKAFSATLAEDFKQSANGGKKMDSSIAGDDEEALQTVAEFVETAGFNTVIAGDLSVSGKLERDGRNRLRQRST